LAAARDHLLADFFDQVLRVEQPGFGRAGGLDTAQEQGVGLLSVSASSIRQDSFDHYLSLVSRRRRNNASLDWPAIHRQRYCISLASALLSYAGQILRPPPGGVMASIWANSSAVSRGSKTAPTSPFSGRKRARRRAWGPKGRWKQYATYGPLLAGHLV